MGNTTIHQDNSHLAAEAKAAGDLRAQESQQAYDLAMKASENEDKEKQRTRLDATINDKKAEIVATETKLKTAQADVIRSKRLVKKYSEQKNDFIEKIKNFSNEKEKQLQAYIIKQKIDIAFENYERDRNEIEDAIAKTGVHSDDVGKFLILTHAMT
eukprot:202702_1